MKYTLPVVIIFQLILCVSADEILYSELFPGDGDITAAGWHGILDSGGSTCGISGDMAWVWHKGICGNLIYTQESPLDTDAYSDIQFTFDLRAHSYYGQSPLCSIAVQIGGNWYVSKTAFASSSTTFSQQSLLYDSEKENWDTLNSTTLTRWAAAASDLAGTITAVGLFSDSTNTGSDCTAEYDNFAITAVQAVRTPDFNGSGGVDLQDFEDFTSGWLSSEGDPAFADDYDLNFDTNVDINDLVLFAEGWLSGIPYPYTQPESPRQKRSFNIGWKFYRGTVSADGAKEPSYDDSSWQTVNVPHTPVITPLRVQWPGPGGEDINWYRRHFTLDSSDQDGKIFIEFEGADQIAQVWVNGSDLGIHYGSYLPFIVDITDYAAFGGADNVIAVKVDGREDEDIPFYGLWYSSGGLYRDVWLYHTDKLHVTNPVYAGIPAGGGIFVSYPQVSSALAQIQIKTHIQNDSSTAKNCTLKTYIVNDQNKVVAQVRDTHAITSSADYTFTQSATVLNPSLWHPDHPNLYTVYTQVYDDTTMVDSEETRIGIRKIAFSKSGGFQINNQPYRFRGANRTQDFPYMGWAMGNLGQQRDAKLLKEAGFNYIRTSHYPPDPSFLEACDEYGILIMDEIPGFQHVGGDLFKARSYQTMRDMIRRDRNHPCVIAWELSLNETDFDSTYAQTAMTIGHEEYPGDQCYIAAWKFDSIYDLYIATPTAGARSYSGNKPLIISEHGHWEYGGGNSTSDVHRAAGITADSYGGGEIPMLQQACNHQESHHLNLGLANMCGDGLWVGIDYGAWPSGVYDFLRLPKFSAYFWKSQRRPDLDLSYLGLDSGPMVYIANYWTASSPTDVKVFSNCQQVRLYINDVLQDTRTPDTAYPTTNLAHPPFTFEGLTFQPGELKAEGLIDGQVAAVYAVRTPGSASTLKIKPETAEVPADGSETIFVYVSILDGNGTTVPDAFNTVHLNISGPAVLVTPADVPAEAGIASFLIRTTETPGAISLMAFATGLTGDSCILQNQ